MAAAPPGYNYATGAGIYSLPAAIVFSVLYAALGVWFLIRFRWEYVLIILFCTSKSFLSSSVSLITTLVF